MKDSALPYELQDLEMSERLRKLSERPSDRERERSSRKEDRERSSRKEDREKSSRGEDRERSRTHRSPSKRDLPPAMR